MADHNLHRQNVLDATSGRGLLHKTEEIVENELETANLRNISSSSLSALIAPLGRIRLFLDGNLTWSDP